MPSRSRSLLSLLLALICFVSLLQSAGATIIATFTDDKCKDSYKSINGPNGYPNGTCTQLRASGPFGSFQVVEEDEGCSVTIYGHDADPDEPCSSQTTKVAELATCYNASWVYYSIDMCTLPLPGSTTSPAVAAATVTVTASSSSNHTGAIVGGIVGGVAGVALILGLGWWLLWSRRRRRRQKQQQQQQLHPHMQMPMPPPVHPPYPVYNANAPLLLPPPPPPPQELSSKSTVEMPNTGKTIKPEVRDVKDVKLQAPDGRYYVELPGQPL